MRTAEVSSAYIQLYGHVTPTWRYNSGLPPACSELSHCECIYLYGRVESCITKSGAVLILGSYRQLVRIGPNSQVANTAKFYVEVNLAKL
jgi:hypothetical protein